MPIANGVAWLLNIDKHTAKRFDKLAADLHINRSELLRMAIGDLLRKKSLIVAGADR
jgi:metal-responsive CopG/Arc/MetJ family transcriptional regulator